MCNGNSTFPTFKSVFVVNKYSISLNDIHSTLAQRINVEIESIVRLAGSRLLNEVNA